MILPEGFNYSSSTGLQVINAVFDCLKLSLFHLHS